MVYTGDSRARNPNRSWWNKPEINNMTEAMTSVGCRDQGKRWHDWCPGRPGLSSRRWSLREDATTGRKNELPCFLSFSHLLLCPQPPHVRPSRCQLTREPRKRGKAKKKKKALKGKWVKQPPPPPASLILPSTWPRNMSLATFPSFWSILEKRSLLFFLRELKLV